MGEKKKNQGVFFPKDINICMKSPLMAPCEKLRHNKVRLRDKGSPASKKVFNSDSVQLPRFTGIPLLLIKSLHQNKDKELGFKASLVHWKWLFESLLLQSLAKPPNTVDVLLFSILDCHKPISSLKCLTWENTF